MGNIHENDAEGHPDKIRVSLTRAALERLIGGVTQIEVDLRQQVVQQFAEKYFKTILADANFQKIADAHAKGLAERVTKIIGERVYDYTSEQYVTQLREDVDRLIKAAAQESVARYIDTVFAAAVKKYEEQVVVDRLTRLETKYLGRLEDRLGKFLSDTDGRLDARVDARVDAFFDQRVRAAALERPSEPEEKPVQVTTPDGT